MENEANSEHTTEPESPKEPQPPTKRYSWRDFYAESFDNDSYCLLMDKQQICMIATQSGELLAEVKGEAFAKDSGIRFTEACAAPPPDELFDEKATRGAYPVEYLEEVIKWAKRRGASSIRMTLKTDKPMMLEFESKENVSLHEEKVKTQFFIAPIIEDSK